MEVALGEGASARVIRQELSIGGGHASGHLGWMHFGLGAVDKVRLRVLWPFGEWSAWQVINADSFYTVDKTRGTSLWKQP